MPGLFGYIKKYPAHSDAISQIIRMQEDLYPVAIEHEHQDENLAGVRCYSFYEKMTHQDATGTIHIWVEGCVYNLAEVAHRYRRVFQDLNQALLWGYQQKLLAEMLAALDGIVCVVIYDRQQKKVTLLTN